MARSPRIDVADHVYHVLNRANARLAVFFVENDYLMFERILKDACIRFDMRILAYCVMPNHFHLVVYPRNDGDLQKFMQWLTLTHTQRWHAKNGTTGTGHLYQGRYKSILVQNDEHLLGLIRYVERNPLRAKLVENLDNWRFSSYWVRKNGTGDQNAILASWPIEIPSAYDDFIYKPMTIEELDTIRSSVHRVQPYGSDEWKLAQRERFQISDRPRGRPRRL